MGHGSALPQPLPAAGAPPLPARYAASVLIGTGGMGSIWAAEDSLLRRRVAIKVLADNLAAQEPFVRRFEREARTAASLSGHPNVITIYDVGTHEARPHIVMEYLPGGTIADRLRAQRPIPHGQVLAWLRQAASALDFAHEHGVVHRDVKPSNFLFDDRERLVIADFGIARAAVEEKLTRTDELLGTAGYISPEQAKGASATSASDRYSLAVVSFELLTGSRPFDGGNFAEQARAQIEDEPPLATAVRPGLSPGVDMALSRGLEKDPAERWQNAGAFVEALASALAVGAEVEAPPVVAERPEPTTQERIEPTPSPAAAAPYQPAPRWHQRRPLPSHAVPVALVVAAAALTGIVGAAVLGGDGGAGGESARERSTNRDRGDRAARAGEKPSEAPAAPAQPSRISPAEGARLNTQGFALMRTGRNREAVPILQRAVASFPAESRELTFAYALYNLGRALRLSGRPQEAIPVLEKRMGFANQRETVARELASARRAARK